MSARVRSDRRSRCGGYGRWPGLVDVVFAQAIDQFVRDDYAAFREWLEAVDGLRVPNGGSRYRSGQGGAQELGHDRAGGLVFATRALLGGPAGRVYRMAGQSRKVGISVHRSPLRISSGSPQML